MRFCSAGISLAVSLTGGNRNDVIQLVPLIQAIPPVRACTGGYIRRAIPVTGQTTRHRNRGRIAACPRAVGRPQRLFDLKQGHGQGEGRLRGVGVILAQYLASAVKDVFVQISRRLNVPEIIRGCGAAQAARRRTSQTVAAMSRTDSASSQPPSIHCNGQNRLPGW